MGFLLSLSVPFSYGTFFFVTLLPTLFLFERKYLARPPKWEIFVHLFVIIFVLIFVFVLYKPYDSDFAFRGTVTHIFDHDTNISRVAYGPAGGQRTIGYLEKKLGNSHFRREDDFTAFHMQYAALVRTYLNSTPQGFLSQKPFF